MHLAQGVAAAAIAAMPVAHGMDHAIWTNGVWAQHLAEALDGRALNASAVVLAMALIPAILL